MKRIQSFFICILLAILSVIWYGCPSPSDCDESGLPTRYYYVSADGETLVPYSGNDTLKFLLNGTDTLLYLGEGTDTSMEFYNGVRECSGEYGYYEERKMRFQTSGSIVGSMKTFDFSLKYIPNAIEYLVFTINGSSARKSIISIGEPYDFPSLIIAGKTYTDVERICSVGQTSTCSDTSFFALYNEQYGLLKIKYHSNVLEILP